MIVFLCTFLMENKYVRYVELALRFQDTILGHLYGVRSRATSVDRKLTS